MRAGTILKVDLTMGSVEKLPSKPFTDIFMGGHGLNIKMIYDSVGPEIGALDPGNMLAFATGPFTGTLCPGSGRTAVAAKSPLTGCLGMSNFGGYWGPELKYAGYDQLLVTGASRKPVYIEIVNDDVTIHDAAHLWGKDNYETAAGIRQERDNPELKILSIGPAGENMVHYASILSRIGDAAGRTGMGAVMGSKKLKAIAVRGTKGIKMADPAGFIDGCLEYHRLLKSSPDYEMFSTTGTAQGQQNNRPARLSPYRNYQTLATENPADIVGFVKANQKKKSGCYACPVRCMDVISVPGIGSGITSCTPYTELTNSIDLADMDDWWEIMLLCQRYGIDTRQLGGTLSWLMECLQRGVITTDDLDGIELKWGEKEPVLQLIEKIVRREGCGDIFANNMKLAAEQLGKGSSEYAIQIKGSAQFTSDFQHFRGRALAAAVETRGDHLHGGSFLECIVETARLKGDKGTEQYFLDMAKEMGGTEKAGEPLSYEGRAQMMKEVILNGQSPDILGHCRFHNSAFLSFPVDTEFESRLLGTGLGRTVTVFDIRLYVERMYTLIRAFNAREGFTREQDILPARWFREPIEGRADEDVLDIEKFEQMKTEHYRLWGWDDMGIPTEATLERLALSDVAADLRDRGIRSRSVLHG